MTFFKTKLPNPAHFLCCRYPPDWPASRLTPPRLLSNLAPDNPMKDKISRKIPSNGRAGDAKRPFFESANVFFHRPAGVFLICLLLFGLTVWAFAPVLKTGFQIFDDEAIFLKNANVNTGLSWQNLRLALFSTDYSYSYPLTRISHMLDFEMYGANPWGHHLTNVLIHAANGVLLFLVLKRITGALWRSLIVAALFALHPLRVESVAWISERKDVLSAFWGLLALWTYARYAEESKTQGGRKKLFYGLTLLFFACGLMSKSMLVTFPCLLLLLDYWPLKRIPDGLFPTGDLKRLVIEKIPFFLLVVPVSIFTYAATKAGGSFFLQLPLSMRLETALMGYARYLGKMFWPANFSALYPYPDFWPVGELLFAAVLILGVSALAFTLRRRQPYFLFGWLWYLGTLVPVIGLIPLGANSLFNRYTYIPMIGILVLLVWAFDDLSKQWWRRNVLIAAVLVLILGVCMFRTRAEIVYWKDSKTLWRRAIAVTEKNFMAHYCLAISLAPDSDPQEWVELQKSVDIYPDYFESQFVLAKIMSLNGRLPDSISHYEKAIQLKPQNSWARHDLGMALIQLKRECDAIPSLLKAVELEPRNEPFKYDLGKSLFLKKQKPCVINNFLAAARSDPAGFASFLDAMQNDTNCVIIINDLAWSFATNPDPDLRNGKYAIRLATRSCEMTSFRFHNNVLALAAAYAEDSHFDDAISIAQIACSMASATGQTQLLKSDQTLLELFRSHQSYHDPITATSP
jgi:tetratricopeptide (TPR) repeat protein